MGWGDGKMDGRMGRRCGLVGGGERNSKAGVGFWRFAGGEERRGGSWELGVGNWESVFFFGKKKKLVG